MRFRKTDLSLEKEGNSPVLVICGRGEDGNKYRHTIRGLESYFFVSEDPYKTLNAEELVKAKSITTGYTSIFGEPLWKISTHMPGDTIELRKPFQRHYEADIHWVERAAIDLKLTDGYTIDDTNSNLLSPVDADNINLRVWVVDIEVSSEPKVRPEPKDPQYPVVCIVLWDSYTKQQVVFESKTMPERQMLEGFLEYLRKTNPDIITGWNVGFDWGYLMNRVRYLTDPRYEPMVYMRPIFVRAFSAYGRASCRFYVHEKGLEQWRFECTGYQVFDMLEAYKVKKNPSGRLSSYNLKAVAKIETGDVWEDYGSCIQEIWEKDYQKVIDYCKKDVEVEAKMLVKENLVDQALAICKLSGCNLSQTTSKEQIIDHALLLRRGNRILPSKPKRKNDDNSVSKPDVKGGLVLIPPPGMHEGVGVFDAAALYPSIIAGFNISAECRRPEGTITITSDINQTFKFISPNVQKGIMPETISEFRALRENVRAQKREAEKIYGHDSKEYKALEELDTADKFIITSFYGVMAFEGFRLFDPACANAITAVWRVLAGGLVEYLKVRGFDVIYGDTDSMFIKVHTIENGYKVKDYIHQYLRDELSKMGVTGSEIEVKFEKFFSKIAFKQRELKKGVFVAAKKKYVGLMTWSEGQPTETIYVRGFETRRSDASTFLKDTMETFFNRWLKGKNDDEAIEYLKQQKKAFFELPVYQIAIPRQISKTTRKVTNTDGESEEVKVNSPWIRGIEFGATMFGWQYDSATAPRLLYLKPRPISSIVKTNSSIGTMAEVSIDVICIQENHTLPSNLEIDYEKMFERSFKKKFAPIVAMMGKDWDQIFEGFRSLDSWFEK